MRTIKITVLITAALLGCEAEPEPPVCEPDPGHVYAPGSAWGPCNSNGSCEAGSCWELTKPDIVDGEIVDVAVANVCTWGICIDDVAFWHPECVETVQLPAVIGGGCLAECTTDSDCVSGQVCDKWCYWPID